MVKYVIKRLLLMLMVFLIITTICFVLIKLLPVIDATQFGKDMEIIKQRREALGYNKPIMEQYIIFVQKSLIGGDWGIGETMYRTQDVWQLFVEKLPATMTVNIYTMLFAVPIGLLLGIYAALKKNKWQDYIISTGVIMVVSVPSYVYAFLIQYFLCHKLQWFPLQVLAGTGTDYLSWKMFVSMIPAIIALGLGTVAGLARYTRAELCEVLTCEYMLLARTKGLTRGQATVRHALRNSMVPIFPMIMGEFIGIIGGSLIVEQFFSIPGVGPLYLQSITAKDYNFFMLLTCFYTAIGLFSGILVDLSYGFVDPRIRIGEK